MRDVNSAVVKGRIEGWAVVCMSDVYTAPECLSFRIQGYVFDGPSGWSDGGHLLTSQVFDHNAPFNEWFEGLHEGDLIRTHSGSWYLLGKRDPRPATIYKYEEAAELWNTQPRFEDYAIGVSEWAGQNLTLEQAAVL